MPQNTYQGHPIRHNPLRALFSACAARILQNLLKLASNFGEKPIFRLFP